MSWRVAWCVTVATLGVCSVARAQVLDSSAAAAVGVYRPAQPPPGAVTGRDTSATVRDTTAAPRTTAAPDTAGTPSDTTSRPRVQESADSVQNPGGPGSRDTSQPDTTGAGGAGGDTISIDPDLPVAEDTSLTARMDVRRGGGLRRFEFPDLRSTATSTGRYTVFLSLIDRSNLRDRLTGDSALTVLAPTDSAFTRLPASDFARLNNDSTVRQRWLETVLLDGSLGTRDLLQAGEVPSRNGVPIPFSQEIGGPVHAGRARLVQPDLIARNGTLHGVDLVVLPGPTSATP
ncbi:MAG: fasciclin domain-containing protein [Gemmatimonadales bacterium]|nr:fasciclin domain-containing protein [Gemmatimonadales bacterium]